ncbi:MAG: septum formation initiator family protein [Oligoflexia bacterium]|nr:septum formation initiator family protein [Oligoflexia bacterium]
MKIVSIFGWGLCLVVSFRLVFADRGLLDYLRTGKVIDEQYLSLRKIDQENKSLDSEIFKIKNDRKHQKRLVRDNLGVIEGDEYLILFAEETGSVGVI